MSNLPLRIWRRGRSKARRQAAELALSEHLPVSSEGLGVNESAEQRFELTSMRSLIQTLERLPEQAWDQQIPSTLSTNIASAVRQRRRSTELRVTPLRSVALAAVALAFVAGALINPFSRGNHGNNVVSRDTARVVLEPLAGAPSTSQAVAYMPGGDQMLVRIHNLPRSAPGTYYELWLMTNPTDLVSVTSFRIRATGTESLQLILPDDPGRYKYLDVSVQHVGARGEISGDNVLRGTIHA